MLWIQVKKELLGLKYVLVEGFEAPAQPSYDWMFA